MPREVLANGTYHILEYPHTLRGTGVDVTQEPPRTVRADRDERNREWPHALADLFESWAMGNGAFGIGIVSEGLVCGLQVASVATEPELYLSVGRRTGIRCCSTYRRG